MIEETIACGGPAGGHFPVGAAPSRRDCERVAGGWLLPVYLLIATPFSMLLYTSCFAQGRAFFAAQAGLLQPRASAPLVAATVLLGAWALARPPRPLGRLGVAVWGVLGGASVVAMSIAPEGSAQAVALALGVPGWACAPAIMAEARSCRDVPVGAPAACLRAGSAIWTAVVLSLAAHTTYVIAFHPGFACDGRRGLALVVRAAAVGGALAAPPAAIFCAASLALRRRRAGGRIALASVGALVAQAISVVVLNALAAVDRPVRPLHMAYALGIAAPLVALLCRRIAAASGGVAEGIASLGRSGGPVREPVVVGKLAVFAGAQALIGWMHTYYEWGARTALFYSALSFCVTAWLLTSIPNVARALVVGTTAVTVAVGLALPSTTPGLALWAKYLRFDKNLGSIAAVLHSLRPRPEPELSRVRHLLDRSHAQGSVDLARERPQHLTLLPSARRPHVFVVVVDALRRSTYSGSDAHQRRSPGVAWMASRFVAYDNAWSSYNATACSIPALLSGAYNPACFEVVDDVRHDNLIARAGHLAGYRCHSVTAADLDASGDWSGCEAVDLPGGGLGQEDPAVVFPAALRAVDEHLRAPDAGPGLFYLHLYNMHQPLLRRPELPLDARGKQSRPGASRTGPSTSSTSRPRSARAWAWRSASRRRSRA